MWFLLEDAILWAVEDDRGTIMVKRLRIRRLDGEPIQ
jgi:hypothetical protein